MKKPIYFCWKSIRIEFGPLIINKLFVKLLITSTFRRFISPKYIRYEPQLLQSNPYCDRTFEGLKVNLNSLMRRLHKSSNVRCSAHRVIFMKSLDIFRIANSFVSFFILFYQLIFFFFFFFEKLNRSKKNKSIKCIGRNNFK